MAKKNAETSKKNPSSVSRKRPVEQYEHKDKQRVNNPPVGLVTPDTDPDVKQGQPKKTYQYDPHLDQHLVEPPYGDKT